MNEGLSIFLAACFGAGMVSASPTAVAFYSSVERYDYQTGDNSQILRSYDGFDNVDSAEISEHSFDGESANGESEYYGVKINGGTVDQIAYNPTYSAYKRAHNYDTSAEMLAVRPTNATYTHVLHLKDETDGAPPNTFYDVEIGITAPGVAFASALPAQPAFSFGGVDGNWSTGNDGIGVFTFDPTVTESFTVTMTKFTVSHLGTHYVFSTVVNRIDQGFEALGQASSGIKSGTEGDPLIELEEITLTFTRGLALDAGDDDDTTYGFQDGSAFELEGEFVNAWLEQDAAAAAALGMDEVSKGFVFETVTAIELRADTPSLYDIWATDNAIPGASFGDDHNGDGVANGILWALGLGATDNPLPALPVATGSTVTFTLPAGGSAGDLLVEGSDVLESGWADLAGGAISTGVNPIPAGTTGTVTITPPAGLPFYGVRLRAVEP